MRRTLSRLTILLLTLVLMVYGINASPVQAATILISSTSGTPGTTVAVSGNFTPNETGITITYDATPVASNIQANAAGIWSSNIIIPHSAAGSHTIAASGSVTTTAVSITFTVVAGVTISQTSGAAGSSVTVTGVGFANGETGISVTFDSTPVAPMTSASAQGDWTTTFAIPASGYGSHIIRAFGATTPATRDISFTVTPGVSINRTGGAPGSSITVSGTGFGASETGITVTYDGTPIASGLVANAQGSWTTTITVPPSPAGSHSIHVYGSTTLAAATSDIAFIVGAGASVSQTSGSPGSSLTVTGSGFAAGETGITVTYDTTTVASGVRANAQGGWTATFVVPASAAGPHTIRAQGSTTATVPDVTFTVNPTVTTNQTTGFPGSSLTVTGSGFAAGETGITVTYDTTTVASSLRANAQGGWTATFLIPTSSAGSHAIHAQGSITLAAATADVVFTISGGISVSQTSGSPGSSITVTGSGFAASETGITVTYDTTNVASGLRANAQGGWTATFVVPASASGSHTIHAYGSTTLAATTSDVIFTVTPGISLSQASGAPGSSITVTGSGFGASETGITVTYDNTTVASGLRANAQGSWNTTFVVPPSPAGSHTIGAYGAVSQAASVNTATYNSAASINLNPSTGYVGATVQIEGFGFAINSPLKFAYDDKDIPAEGATTDTTGSFTKTITIPTSKAGAHTVRVTDAQKNDVKATFTMDSAPPPVPNPSSPDDGARVGILGGVMPTLRWSTSTDPSGVTYQLQIDTSPDFSQPVLDKTGIPRNSYILTASEALPLGEYFWRVKAIDGASNQSTWSQPRVLKSGLMPLTTLLIIIAAGLAAVAVAVYLLLKRRPAARRREAIEVPEGEAPRVVVTGQWRAIEGPSEEQQTKERPLPLRLALPQPAKGTKTLSTEEQARLKVIVDFAQALPLVEPGYTTNWLLDLLESGTGIEASTPVYEQLLKGELQVLYEPAWIHHPTYQDLTSLLEGQPILQDLNAFVDATNRRTAEVTSLLQDIYRDSIAEIPMGFLEKGGWGFISAVYSDATSWFMGKSLRDPSERDYSIKPRSDDDSGTLLLYGGDTTSFAGPLIQAADEKEGLQLRSLHLKLRRNYRNSAKAKEVVSMMTQLEVQRSRLLNVFSQFGRLRQ